MGWRGGGGWEITLRQSRALSPYRATRQVESESKILLFVLLQDPTTSLGSKTAEMLAHSYAEF